MTYNTDIPRMVGLSGSSAIIAASVIQGTTLATHSMCSTTFWRAYSYGYVAGLGQHTNPSALVGAQRLRLCLRLAASRGAMMENPCDTPCYTCSRHATH